MNALKRHGCTYLTDRKAAKNLRMITDKFEFEVKVRSIPKLDEAVKWILEFEKLHPARILSIKIELFD